jgi:hypothetical protein
LTEDLMAQLAAAAEEMSKAQQIYEAARIGYLAKREAWIILMEQAFEPQFTDESRKS